MDADIFKRAKEFTLNIAICVLIVAIVFISLEIILRWQLRAFPFNYECRPEKGFVPDEQLGYRVKNIQGYNSLGLRNPEILPKADQFRVLFLGDSVVEGFDAGLLKKRLETYYPHIKIEVINAGVSGYTTKQELDFLKQYGISISPDLVILGFVLNDLFTYLHKPNMKGELRGWHPDAERAWFAGTSFAGKIFYRSYLAHYIAKSINLVYQELKRRFGRHTYEFEIRTDFHAAWKDFMWKGEERLLTNMKNLLKSNNIPLVIACFPVKEQIDEENIKRDKPFVLKPQRRLLEICQKLKIPLLDLWSNFYEITDKEFLCDYLHFTQEGNVIIADKLAEFINEQHLIKNR
jgi:lysophospholipase L1-like esterase